MTIKKILALVLCVTMLLGTMSFTVFADEISASAADEFYNAVKDAQSGDVINLDASVTYEEWESIWNKNGLTINGNGNTITVNAIDSGVNGGGLFLNAENLTINDLTVYLPESATERPRLAIMKSGTLNNITVIGGTHGVSVSGDVTIDNCTFEGQSEWAVETESKSSTASLTITDCTFDENAVILRGENNTFSGNKITDAGEGVNVLGDAVISGNDFGESTLGIDRGVTVTVENNIINSVGLTTWLDGDYSEVTVESNTLSDEALESLQTIDETIVSVNPVAKIESKAYYSLNDALAAAVDGDTIIICEDINGNIPGTTLDNITFKAEGDVEVSGKVSLGGTGTADVAEGTLTFDGFTFTGTRDIINAHDGNEKLGKLDIVVKNCKFPDAQKTVVMMPGWATSLEAPKSVTIDNCEFITTTYVGEIVSLQKVAKAVVKNSKFTCTDTSNPKASAMNFTYSVADVTVENNVIKGFGRGVGLGMNMIPEGTEATVVIDNNDIDTTVAINVSSNLTNQQAGGSVAPIIVTDNTITAETVINNATSELITDIVDTVNLTGNTVNEEAWTDVKEHTTSITVAVAKIGETEYKSLEAALAAAEDGSVINLLGNTIAPVKAIVIPDDKTLTIADGTIDLTDIDSTASDFVDDRGIYAVPFTALGKLILDNAKITGNNVVAAQGIVVVADGGELVLVNGAEINLADVDATAIIYGDGASPKLTMEADTKIVYDGENNGTGTRGILSAELDVEEATINLKNLNDNALHNVTGSILGSAVTVDGAKYGLKNDAGKTVTVSNSTLEVVNTSNETENAGVYLVNRENLADTNSIIDAKIFIEGGTVYNTLTFETNSDSVIASVTDRESNAVVDLSGYTPEKTGYTFVGWYSDAALTQRISAVTLDDATTVYAKWRSKAPVSVSSSGVANYSVTFKTNGGTAISKVSKKINTVVDLANYVTEKEGYAFDGWYTDKELSNKATSIKLTKNITVYAKWVEITDETDEWENPFADVNQADEWKNPFTDVNPGDWYYGNVQYAAENNLMNGTDETTFSPNGSLTRAMLVTVLYRLEGEPATNKSIPFADVGMGEYYANAVSWAKQNGIVNGVTENEFAPDANITREQIAAIMHRYAQYKGYDVSAYENTNILSYDDYSSISGYATGSVQYAVGSGLMKGKTASTLNPQDFATRAEIAAILQRFIRANK